MAPRTELQTLLETLAANVYFQPPANVAMAYPAIVYHRDDIRVAFADNSPYRLTKRYQVTVIERNPDSAIPDSVIMLPRCRFSRHFVANNLYLRRLSTR